MNTNIPFESVCQCPHCCKFRTIAYVGNGEDEVVCMSAVCPIGINLIKKVDYQSHEN